MDELLDAIAALVSLVPPEKVQAIASRVRRTESGLVATALRDVGGNALTSSVIEQLTIAWQSSQVGPDELASMLLAASHTYGKANAVQAVELVWTGPTTPFVPARRTEQALLEVINGAERTLHITSFVAYDVSTIVKALNAAGERGVAISMLLELSQEHGGAITFDAARLMSVLVPTAKLYAWREKAEAFANGSVHAKVAAADGRLCFITSANLTGRAMEQNMEAGVLISGGTTPRLVRDHLQALIDTKVVAFV